MIPPKDEDKVYRNEHIAEMVLLIDMSVDIGREIVCALRVGYGIS